MEKCIWADGIHKVVVDDEAGQVKILEDHYADGVTTVVPASVPAGGPLPPVEVKATAKAIVTVTKTIVMSVAEFREMALSWTRHEHQG